MATQVVLTYRITRSNLSMAELLAAVQAVVLPTTNLEPLGVSLVSDNSVIVFDQVHRTLTFSLLPILTSFALDPLPATAASRFSGSIVSSSPEDKENGTGVRRVNIRYTPILGSTSRVKSFQASLNGTTPVNFISDKNSPGDINTILSLSAVEVGSFGVNVGLISVYTQLDARYGKVRAQINSNFQGSILSTSPEDNVNGVGARQLTITYDDVAGGGPFVEVVVPDGNTPVNLVNLNHFTVSAIDVTLAGSATQNLGIITLFSGLNGTGGPVARLEPSFFTYFPPGTADYGPFVSQFAQILSANLASIVSSDVPSFI